MVVYIRRMLFSHPRGVDDYLPNNYEKKRNPAVFYYFSASLV
jgi:hypothetical protein